MTDNLPELPEPHHAYQNGVGMDNWAGDYFTADQMRSYAITARESERARADALEAALKELVDRLANNTLFDAEYGHWQRARSLLEKTNDR